MMMVLYCLWVFAFKFVNGFLCGDDAVCNCIVAEKTIFCRNSEKAEDIEFRDGLLDRYDRIIVSDEMSCTDKITLGISTGLHIVNSNPCHQQKTQLDNPPVMPPGMQPPAPVRISSERERADSSSGTSTYDISLTIVNGVLLLIMGVVNMKLHYNMRPFTRLLPTPYKRFNSFVAYIFRRNMDIPDVSNHVHEMTFTGNRTERNVFNHVQETTFTGDRSEGDVLTSSPNKKVVDFLEAPSNIAMDEELSETTLCFEPKMSSTTKMKTPYKNKLEIINEVGESGGYNHKQKKKSAPPFNPRKGNIDV